jgi:N-terminal half of MaoC dehydratase/MaoC like domain
MPCDSRIVGKVLGPFEYDVDPFWTMAYAAGIGDANPRYIDSMGTGRLIAHPVFPVCLATKARWLMEPTFLAAGLTPEESIRSVHVTQDMICHWPIRPPERLVVTATVAALERRRAGTYLLTRYDIRDTSGAPVSTIDWGRLWRGVDMTGPERPSLTKHPACLPNNDAIRACFDIPIAPTAAIVYTACARADNQVSFHTDTAAANRSGLRAPLLMGVATLAMSVSRIIDCEAGGDPERVARIACRFGAMVFVPTELTLEVLAREYDNDGDRVFFELRNADGGRAIRDGVAVLRS